MVCAFSSTTPPRNTKGANLTHPTGGTAKRPSRDTPSRARLGARRAGLSTKNSRFSSETAAKAALKFLVFSFYINNLPNAPLLDEKISAARLNKTTDNFLSKYAESANFPLENTGIAQFSPLTGSGFTGKSPQAVTTCRDNNFRIGARPPDTGGNRCFPANPPAGTSKLSVIVRPVFGYDLIFHAVIAWQPSPTHSREPRAQGISRNGPHTCLQRRAP